MKKLLSLAISLILFVSAIPAFGAEADAATEYDYFLEAQELLKGLGCSDVSPKRATPISRESWLNLATEFSYYDTLTRQNLAGAGIHSDTNYYFYPEASLKVQDAIIMLVKLLGYQPGVEHSDTIYLNAGKKIGLFDGLYAKTTDDVTYESAYIMLYNYLNANTAEYTITSTDVNIKTGDSNILFDKYGISLVEGQVSASPSYSLTEDVGVGEGYLTINGELCNNLRYNGDDYFGKKVKAYVRDFGGINEIVSIVVTSDSSIYKIDADDLVSFKDKTLTYYEETGKEKKIKISLYADIFCNGERFDSSEKSFIPKSGCVTVIDNNTLSDGADVVLIENTTDVKVSASISQSHKVYSKDDPAMTYFIGDDTLLITPDGVKMDFDSIITGDILTIWLKADNSVWKAMVCTKTVNGTIEEIADDYIVINGTKYAVSPDRLSYFKDVLKPGKTIDGIINTYGKLTDAYETTALDGAVAIMTECAYRQQGMSESLRFKLYDTYGEFLTFFADEKITINGSKAFKTLKEAFDAIPKLEGTDKAKQTLILYKLNEENEIISVNYASSVPMDTTSSSKLYLTKHIENSDSSTGKYKRYSKFLGPNLMVEPSTTVLFKVPKQNEDGTSIDNEDLYTTSKLISITSGTIFSSCKISGYSLNPEDKVAQYVTVEYDASDSDTNVVEGDVRLSMVGEIKQCIHNEEPVEAITIYNHSNVGGITIYGKTTSYFSDFGFEPGDLVRIKYNSETKIASGAELIWKKGSETLANNTYSFFGEGKICDVRFCNVFKRWGVTIDLFYKGEDLSQVTTDDAMVFRADLYTIFRYNERLKSVETVSYDEFVTYDVASTNCSEVVLETRYRDPMSIFITK